MGGRFQPGLSAVRVGASLAFAALMEPDESEAAKEASVLVTWAAEKLELWGKLPNANLGLFIGSYCGRTGEVEDSKTTRVSTFSTGVGLTARVVGSVAALPPLREEKEIEVGTGGDFVGDFVGLVAA